jgi:hypothetical protein
MARATYEALRSYPAIQGHVRQAAEWKSLEVDVQGFAKGRTKAEKLAWFVAHGMDDPRILNDLSLPGALNDVAQWPGYKLPALTQGASLQGEVPQEVRLYFDRLLERWLSSSAVESVLDDEVGELRNGAHKHQEPATRELLARLALWKLADHGSAATLAHAAAPLSNAQIQQVDRLARMPRAFVSVRSVADALFPIEAIGPKATPLLPYLVTLSATEPARATALLRLKHAPYDTLLLVAERRSGEWRLAEVVGVVNP